MKLEAKAGGMKLTAFTDGVPAAVYLMVNNGPEQRLSYNDLHDLRYAAGRMMDHIENEVTNPRHR